MLSKSTHIENFNKYPIRLLPEKSDSAVSMCTPFNKPKSGTSIMEIWKDVPEYEGLYLVSNLGRVKSIKRHGTKGIILRQHLDHRGYSRAMLCKENKIKLFVVSRLVLIAFVPNPHNLPQANHINGNKTDNRVENLEWCSASQNIIHAYKLGLIKCPTGENHWFAKLNWDSVRSIRTEYPSKTMKELAKEYNVAVVTIFDVIHNKTWIDA